MTTNVANSSEVGAEFIESMCAEAINSAAVNHPYLQAMRAGSFPDVEAAFQDFAFQYGLYSANFTRYVSAVIRNLSNAKDREILLENLAEEQGDTHDVELPPDVLATVDGVPHTHLYRRFQEALGVQPDEQEITPDCPGVVWSEHFLALCKENEFIAAGAIGIGTELIVARIFDQILEGIKGYGKLTMAERVFFDLHSVCDDQHAAQMITITKDLAQDESSRYQIAQGVKEALRLRAEFWDKLLARAQAMPKSNAANAGETSVG